MIALGWKPIYKQKTACFAIPSLKQKLSNDKSDLTQGTNCISPAHKAQSGSNGTSVNM